MPAVVVVTVVLRARNARAVAAIEAQGEQGSPDPRCDRRNHPAPPRNEWAGGPRQTDMHDRNNPQTLIALEPPTMPTMDLLPPPDIYPPAFPAPQRSTGGRLPRLVRRLRDLLGDLLGDLRRQPPGQ